MEGSTSCKPRAVIEKRHRSDPRGRDQPTAVWALRGSPTHETYSPRVKKVGAIPRCHAIGAGKPFAGGTNSHNDSPRCASVRRLPPATTNTANHALANEREFLPDNGANEPRVISRPQGRRRAMVRAAAGGGTGWQTLISVHEARARLNGAPWLAGVRLSRVPELSELLQTACYVLIAYLSGMRDSDVKPSARGCRSGQRDSDGKRIPANHHSSAFQRRPDKE